MVGKHNKKAHYHKKNALIQIVTEQGGKMVLDSSGLLISGRTFPSRLVLCVFEEAGTDIVLSELWKFRKTKDLRRCGEHADTEHPLERSHLAIDSRIGGVLTLAMVNVLRHQIACDFQSLVRAAGFTSTCRRHRSI
jgi:hypothetical protein